MNILQQFEQDQLTKLTKDKSIPKFSSGDTIRVMVKVIEGSRERIQAYEGVCIARKNAGINSSFTVRKISYGEGVERVFPLHSPNIEIKLIRRGSVRRAKLYYLRGLTGKKARIAEKIVRKTNVESPIVQKDVVSAEKTVKESAPKKGTESAVKKKIKSSTTKESKESKTAEKDKPEIKKEKKAE